MSQSREEASIATNGGSSQQAPPLRIVWGQLTEKNVRQLQRLNVSIFPVKYNDLFYSEAVNAPAGFVKLAFFNELLVGSVCCRKESCVSPDSPSEPEGEAGQKTSKLYIMTLGVLAPYRERGIGKQLIEHVLELVRTSDECKDVGEIYLHVQDGNDDALRFYRKCGFAVKERLEGYYKRIGPPGNAAYYVHKKIQ